MSVLNKIFPSEANNGYGGSAIAFYMAFPFMAIFTFRSLVHFLKDDSGVNSIASIIVFPGSPDPNTVIYMFSSLWGKPAVDHAADLRGPFSGVTETCFPSCMY